MIAKFDGSVASYLTKAFSPLNAYKFLFDVRFPSATVAALLDNDLNGSASIFVVGDTRADELYGTLDGGWLWSTDWTADTKRILLDTWTSVEVDVNFVTGTNWNLVWKINGVTAFTSPGVDFGQNDTTPMTVDLGPKFVSGIAGENYFIKNFVAKDGSGSTIFSNNLSVDFSGFDSTTGSASVVAESTIPAPVVSGKSVSWIPKCYDIDGNPVTADYSDYDPGNLTTSEEISYATAQSLEFNLNGIDVYQFDLYLDDPMALNIVALKTVVKVFRSVNDFEANKLLVPTQPVFSGIVSSVIKNGAANTMTVRAFNPLWRLQSHFHLDNHYLEINPDTTVAWTQSELIWKLIDLINNAFGDASQTGITQGTFSWGLPDEPQVAPYFVAKGSNTWANIFDDIMMRAASVDIIPEYYHSDGSSTLMLFSTSEKRGQDKSADFSFNYYTDPNTLVPNCDDMTEEETPIPGNADGGFANYLWVVGMGGPNSGKISMKENNSGTPGSNGYGEIGVYMARVDREEIKRLSGNGGLGKIAEAEFAQRKVPGLSYTVVPSPAASIYYDVDYTMGDVIAINANKGALVVSDIKQRVYQVTLAMSDNSVENASVLVAKDFYGNVEGS